MACIMQGPTVISSKEFTYGEKMTAKPHITRLVREEGHNIRTPPLVIHVSYSMAPPYKAKLTY